ncbi:MAG: YHYH domain-containing protein [Gemmatimonadetes bacterium]|nr:YHYH domain-containing protein [Gemmatimonadota bacterium]
MFKFLISCLLIFSGLTNTDGHGGGLDQNGGHWDRKAGTYHYHRPRSGSSENSQSSLVQVNKNTKDISMLGVQVSGILASLTNIQSRISTLEAMVESKLSRLLTRVDSIQIARPEIKRETIVRWINDPVSIGWSASSDQTDYSTVQFSFKLSDFAEDMKIDISEVVNYTYFILDIALGTGEDGLPTPNVAVPVHLATAFSSVLSEDRIIFVLKVEPKDIHKDKIESIQSLSNRTRPRNSYLHLLAVRK